MNTFSRNLSFISIMLMAGCSSPHQESKTYTMKEVGWTITVPPEFKVADSAKIAAQTEEGVKAIEKSNDLKVDASTTKTLINASKGHNTFNATITPFDTTKDGDFATAIQAAKEIIYKTFLDQMPTAKVDTNSSTGTVGALEFDQFHINVKVEDKTVFNMYMLSKLYKGYDFGITYLYMDDTTKRQIDGILDSSQFQ